MEKLLEAMMESRFTDTATSIAVKLAKLAVTKYGAESPGRMAVEEAWQQVREVLVAQASADSRNEMRLDLDELFDNTKVHALTGQRKRAGLR